MQKGRSCCQSKWETDAVKPNDSQPLSNDSQLLLWQILGLNSCQSKWFITFAKANESQLLLWQIRCLNICISKWFTTFAKANESQLLLWQIGINCNWATTFANTNTTTVNDINLIKCVTNVSMVKGS